MTLRGISIRGYRRFADQQSMRVSGRLTAVVGPSQSGKSSIIAALDEFGSTGPFSRSDLSSLDKPGDDEIVVSAQYDYPSDALFGMAPGATVQVRRIRKASGQEQILHRTRGGQWRPLGNESLSEELPAFEELRTYEGDAYVHVSEMSRYGLGDDGTLTNLLVGLGECDLQALRIAFEGSDLPRARQLVTDAEDRINAHLAEYSFVGFPGLEVRFPISERTVELHAGTHSSSPRLLSQNSAGVRSFLTIVAAIHHDEHRGFMEGPPVILIDEVETHLHVDAQTDLIQYLDRQKSIPQLIYTTHSMTCLPSDLGTGLRAVIPNGRDRSVIVNSPWSLDRTAGLSPVFVTAGASSSVFAALRRAVFTEGPSDPILLPTLLRNALGLAAIDFQCLPGLAWVARDRVAPFSFDAARTVHVVDGDASGRDIAALLKDIGVTDADILILGGAREEEIVIEDLVDAAAYATAVQAATSDLLGRSVPSLPKSALEHAWNRPRVVANWTDQNCLPAPSKVDVAERLAANADRESIVDEARAHILRELYKQIVQRLDE